MPIKNLQSIAKILVPVDFRGRIGVFEIATVDEPFSEAIGRGASLHELREILRDAGVRSLEGDALVKVREGVISYQEAQQMRWL